jgi:hypothetical protein
VCARVNALGSRARALHHVDMHGSELRRFSRAAAVLLGAAAAAGCDVSAAWPEDDLQPDSTTLPCRTTRVAPIELEAFEGLEPIEVAETDARTDVVALSVQGRGDDFVGNVSLVDGVGRLSLGCEAVPAAIYSRGSGNEGQWFNGVAVKPDRLYPFSLLCLAGELRGFYYQGTDGTASTYEPATGSCRELSATVSSRVRLPAANVVLPKLVSGFTIDGRELSLALDGKGSLMLGGVEQRFAVFDVTGCGDDCEDDEWHSLHALIWQPGEQNVSLAQLELFGPEDPIELDFTVTLPSFTSELAGLSFDATFTTP